MNVWNIVGIIIGIAGGLGGGVAVLYSARTNYLIKILQDENEVLSKSKDRLDADNKTLLVERDAAVHKATFMQELIQGAPDWNKLGIQMATQHQDAQKNFTKVINKLGDVAMQVGKLAQSIEARK